MMHQEECLAILEKINERKSYCSFCSHYEKEHIKAYITKICEEELDPMHEMEELTKTMTRRMEIEM